MTDDVLLDYAEQFVGIGDPSSPYWCVWTGPAFPKQLGGDDWWNVSDEGELAIERERLSGILERWSVLRKPTFDVSGSHTVAGGYPYQRALGRIAEALGGHGRKTATAMRVPGDFFRAEFFPLSIDALLELGTKEIFKPFLRSSRRYSSYRVIQRFRYIRSQILLFDPRVVLMFGRSLEHIWREIPEPVERHVWHRRRGMYWTVAGNRLYISTPSPVSLYQPIDLDAFASGVRCILNLAVKRYALRDEWFSI